MPLNDLENGCAGFGLGAKSEGPVHGVAQWGAFERQGQVSPAHQRAGAHGDFNGSRIVRFAHEQPANLIGNGVATLVVSRSENAFDDEKRIAAEAAMG